MICEGTNVDFFAEACFLCLGFECLNPTAQVLVALGVLPFGFWGQWFASVWKAAEFETQFAGFQTLAADLVVLLRRIQRPMAMTAGVGAVAQMIEEFRNYINKTKTSAATV